MPPLAAALLKLPSHRPSRCRECRRRRHHPRLRDRSPEKVITEYSIYTVQTNCRFFFDFKIIRSNYGKTLNASYNMKSVLCKLNIINVKQLLKKSTHMNSCNTKLQNKKKKILKLSYFRLT